MNTTNHLRSVAFAVIGLCFGILSSCKQPQSSQVEDVDPTKEKAQVDPLVILTWDEYFSDGLVESFEAETGIPVEFVTFENLDEMDALLRSRPADFDLLVASGGVVADLIELGFVQSIDRSQIPLFSNLDDRFLGLHFDPRNEYSLPYMWGTTLIAYRSDKIDEPDPSWKSLWNEDYRNRVLMVDDGFDVYAAALLANGSDLNSQNTDELEKATENLLSQADKLGAKFVDIFKIRDQLVAGECWISMTYSSDAAVLAEEEENISYFIPEEGAPLWVDSFVLPRESNNQEAAHRFLDFLCRPEVAAENSNELWCASANREAKPFLSKEVLEDPTLYLSDEVMARCRPEAQTSPERQRLVNQGLKRVFDRVREKESKPELSLLIWEEYLAPGIVERFEKETGVNLKITEVENSERLKQELASRPGGFDLIVADEQTLRELISLRLLRSIDQGKISEVTSQMDPAVASPVDPRFEHSSPYLWGLTVLAGRKEVVKDLEPSWSLLWREDLRIGILDEPADLVWLALLGLGYDPAAATAEQIDEASNRLAARFPDFADQMTDLFTGLNELEAGNLDLVVTYNGDAISRAAHNPELSVMFPKEGAPIWIDSFAVCRDAASPGLAHDFIRFMGREDISAETSNELCYATPSRNARSRIAPELLANPVLYPDEQTIRKCSFVQFSPEVERQVHQAISRLVSGVRAPESGTVGRVQTTGKMEKLAGLSPDALD